MMFTRPRGTRDFLPEEMRKRRWAEGRMREVLERFGFEEIASPTFESVELFTERSGDEIVDQLYAFEDKSGRKLALRPELTAPTMRLYSESLSRRPKPIRLYYFENCFRYERPQKGRYREFWQLGAETIGKRTTLRTLDTILAAYTAIEATGLKGPPLKLNHITLTKQLIKLMGGGEKETLKVLRTLDKGDLEGFMEILSKRNPDVALPFKEFFEAPSREGLESILSLLKPDGEKMEELRGYYRDLESVIEILHSLGIEEAYLSPGVVRGLDYYDGVVFEIDDPMLGAESQICGGGEYIFTFLGRETIEGVGFAVGFDRLLLGLKERGTQGGERRETVLLAVLEEGLETFALQASIRIRNAGVAVEVIETGGGLKKALTIAAKRGYRKVAVVGRDEVERGVIMVRDLIKREQTYIPLDRLTEAFSEDDSS